MPETVIYLCRSTNLMVSCLLILPWCIAIAGYWMSSKYSNNQQQPTTSYKIIQIATRYEEANKSATHHKQDIQMTI